MPPARGVDQFIPVHPRLLAVRRHDLLKRLHELLAPRTYLEIGVSTGASMTLSRTRSIGVDPAFQVRKEIHCDVHLVPDTSDEFFARRDPLAHFDVPVIDLAFIDGMHLAEYALRDFINVERYTHPGSVIVFDDMLPRTAAEARRNHRTRAENRFWAGDVFKVVATLQELRPDLVCLEVDTDPTGTTVVLLPDASSKTLLEHYDDLVGQFVTPDPQQVPMEVITRSRAIDPQWLLSLDLWADLRKLRSRGDARARERATRLVNGAGIRTAA
jgi:hypothetical protein